jgi:putative ABC transport system permease protein
MPVSFETAFYELGLYLSVGLLVIVVAAIVLGLMTLPGFYAVLFGLRLLIAAAQNTGVRIFNYLGLIFRNITRNLLRTSLTYVAIFVLVFVISGIWSMLNFIDSITQEKENNLKAIITEKYKIPSQMPRSFEREVVDIAFNLPEEMRPKNGLDDIMTWSFVGGSTDPNNRSLKNIIFFFAMEPRKLLTMMDGLEEFSPSEMAMLAAAVQEAERNIKAVVIGEEKLELMEKRVGDRIKISSLNYPGLQFEMEIIASFPKESRYAQSAVMNREYFYRAIDEHERRLGKTEFSDKCLNLIWIRLPSKEAFERMASEINETANAQGTRTRRFSPAIKMETASSAIGTWLDPYRDIFWGMRWVLSPMIIVIITLIIAIAVSIGVRERRTEMAVLKVLGFKPWQLLALVLVEALLVGLISGTISTTLIYVMINYLGGLPIKVAFFPKFMLTPSVLAWGPIIGGAAAFVGSVIPAWNTQKIRAAEVFARVA